MCWTTIRTVCRKELLETSRDWRALLVMVALPAVLYPALLLISCQVVVHRQQQVRNERAKIIFAGPVPENVMAQLLSRKMEPVKPEATIPDVPQTFSDGRSTPRLAEWAAGCLARRRADVVAVFPADFEKQLTTESTAGVTLFYDDTSVGSTSAMRELAEVLNTYAGVVMERRQAAHPQLSKGFAKPIDLRKASVTSPARKARYAAAHILPSLLLVMVLFSAFYPAVDLTAGERERGTLQTLLTAPVSAEELVLGKYLAATVLSATAATANLGSMFGAVWLLLVSGQIPGGAELAFTWTAGAAVFVQLLLAVLLMSGLMMAVAACASNFREAQNLLTPVYLLVLAPVMVAGMPGTHLDYTTAFTPVVNVALLTKDAILGRWDPLLAGATLTAGLLHCLLAVYAAAVAFRGEHIVSGSSGAFLDALRTQLDDRPRPTPLLAILVFAAVFSLNLFGGTILQSWNLVLGLPLSQFLFMILPVVVAVLAFKLNARDVLLLRLPSRRALCGTALMGMSSWLVLGGAAGWLQNVLLPEPQAVSELVRKALGLSTDGMPFTVMLFTFAVTPAICEETLFRGFFLAGMRTRYGRWSSVLITSLCFGVLHLSIYRMMPAAIIGVVIGLIAWETGSILPGILFHFLHNALTLAAHKGDWFEAITINEGGGWTVVAAFAGLFLAGAALVAKAPRPGGTARKSRPFPLHPARRCVQSM